MEQQRSNKKNAAGHHLDWSSSPVPLELLPYHQSLAGGYPQLQLEERNLCPQSQEDTGERLDLKPAPRRDLIPPTKKEREKKPPIFLSPCVCFSLTLLSLSFPLSPSTFYPQPFRRLPLTTDMDLSARCLFVLSCLGVISATDLDAIDPGYYVAPSATSEAIDYKDPCKAGEISSPLCLCAVRSPRFTRRWERAARTDRAVKRF